MQENISVTNPELFQQYCPYFFRIPDQKAQIKTIKNELIKIEDEIRAEEEAKISEQRYQNSLSDEQISVLHNYGKKIITLNKIVQEQKEQSHAVTQYSKAISRRRKACCQTNSLKDDAISYSKYQRFNLKKYNSLLEAKIIEQLKIQDKTTLGERRLVLTSVAKFFNNPLLIIDNPKKIILQKQQGSENILVCWYEDGKIKRESLKAEKLSDDLQAGFPIQTGIENAIEISEKNLVQAVTSTLTSYSSSWFDVIPVEIRNFFKKILLLVESFSSIPNRDEVPEFENKLKFINRNYVFDSYIKILKFYREKYEKNEQKLNQLLQKLAEKKQALDESKNKNHVENCIAVEDCIAIDPNILINEFKIIIKKTQEKITSFDNIYLDLVVENELLEKNVITLEKKLSDSLWFHSNSKHFKKDLYQLTKEMIERVAVPALPDELVYKAYPHLPNRV